MFGSVIPTPGGTWFRYPLEAVRLEAHVAVPGSSAITVLWKGDTAIHDIGAFFERAAYEVRGYKGDYYVLIIDQAGPRPFRASHVVPIPNEILASARFIRFECPPDREAGESPLIVWANLDREVDPDQASIGVYLRHHDLPALRDGISRIVVRTTSDPRTEAVMIGKREDQVRHALWDLDSDIKEASQLPSP